jgi:hypothetical protein
MKTAYLFLSLTLMTGTIAAQEGRAGRAFRQLHGCAAQQSHRRKASDGKRSIA